MNPSCRFESRLAEAKPALLRYVRSVIDDPEDQADLVSEALVRAWKGFEGFDPEKSFEAWLLAIAHNAFIDYLRLRKARPRTVFDDDAMDAAADLSASPLDRAVSGDELLLIARLIEDLPPRWAEALRLAVEGKETAEIGSVLGVCQSRASRIVSKARTALALALANPNQHETLPPLRRRADRGRGRKSRPGDRPQTIGS